MDATIIPCLWFDNQVEEAVKFYTTIFKNGKTGVVTGYTNNDTLIEGSILIISFSLAGQDFIAFNGGPYFKFTPATSFFVGCEDVNEFDELWEKLSEEGSVLMEAEPLPPFFDKFGWVQDKYGLSWQLGICGIPQYITPYLMFIGKQYGRAEDAIRFYRSTFETSSLDSIVRYGKTEHETEGNVQHASFSLNGQAFMVSENAWEHAFTFTEAVSFYVYCKTQADIDRYWEALSEGGEKSQCGWLKDKFGVSWQIVPENLGKMMADKNPEKVRRVSEIMLKMTKLDMDALQRAYKNK